MQKFKLGGAMQEIDQNDRLRFRQQLSLFVLLIVLGVASRFGLAEWHNFKPVAAIALFAGFLFANRLLAIAVPVLIMTISDLGIGAYPWPLALSVYLSMLVGSFLGMNVRRFSETSWGQRMVARLGLFAVASLVMSTFFFVVTNGCFWLIGNWYPMTWSGLVQCYIAALPFFRATLIGDLSFTWLLLAAYQLARSESLRRALSEFRIAFVWMGKPK
jgi:hypothetical protein